MSISTHTLTETDIHHFILEWIHRIALPDKVILLEKNGAVHAHIHTPKVQIAIVTRAFYYYFTLNINYNSFLWFSAFALCVCLSVCVPSNLYPIDLDLFKSLRKYTHSHTHYKRVEKGPNGTRENRQHTTEWGNWMGLRREMDSFSVLLTLNKRAEPYLSVCQSLPPLSVCEIYDFN